MSEDNFRGRERKIGRILQVVAWHHDRLANWPSVVRKLLIIKTAEVQQLLDRAQSSIVIAVQGKSVQNREQKAESRWLGDLSALWANRSCGCDTGTVQEPRRGSFSRWKPVPQGWWGIAHQEDYACHSELSSVGTGDSAIQWIVTKHYKSTINAVTNQKRKCLKSYIP
jgi:hypothetical protein